MSTYSHAFFVTPTILISEHGASPAPLMETPGKTSRASQFASHMTPLAPTPLQRGNDGVFTPSLFYGASDFGTPSWGGDDAKMLQEVLSSRHLGAHSTAVTPAIVRGASLRLPDPAASSTPRVFFKDQLTETYNFKKPCHSPFVVSFSFPFFRFWTQRNTFQLTLPCCFQETPYSATKTTPSKNETGVVTGSGPSRNRLSAASMEDRGKF